MDSSAEFYCAFCGEVNYTFIDFGGGSFQSYVEDCQVCCQPNILFVQVDEDSLEIEINSEPES